MNGTRDNLATGWLSTRWPGNQIIFSPYRKPPSVTMRAQRYCLKNENNESTLHCNLTNNYWITIGSRLTNKFLSFTPSTFATVSHLFIYTLLSPMLTATFKYQFNVLLSTHVLSTILFLKKYWWSFEMCVVFSSTNLNQEANNDLECISFSE